MRSYRTSTAARGISDVTARSAGTEDAIGDRPPAPGSFSAALSAAEQIVVDGLTEMWASRSAAGGPDRRALLASLTNRATVLTLRATIEGARTVGGQAANRDRVARKMRTGDAIRRPLPGPWASGADAGGSATRSAAGAA